MTEAEGILLVLLSRLGLDAPQESVRHEYCDGIDHYWPDVKLKWFSTVVRPVTVE